MSKFNDRSNSSTKTVNKAGGEAFAESPKLGLISILLTSMMKDQYYRKADETVQEVKDLIPKAGYKFSAQAAIYARNEFGMRSISHVVAREIARVSGETWTKNFFDKVIRRPDDITEIMALYLSDNNGSTTLSAAMKKGFASALGRFDAYQLAKYRGEGSGVKLVDVVNLTRPVPTEKSETGLRQLVEGTLRNSETYEAKLSRAGQEAKESDISKEDLKAAAWSELLGEGTIGYFALLRNLRNILDQAPEQVERAVELLTDEKRIRKSLVLPFRYVTALGEVGTSNSFSGDTELIRKVVIGLNKAVDISLGNVPVFEGRTLVALDESGSMRGNYLGSMKGNYLRSTGIAPGAPFAIGALFAAMLVKTNNADLLTFSNDARFQMVNPLDSTITIANSITFNNGGTNFHSIFERTSKPYDRIIILSDMQGWVGYNAPTISLERYRSRVGANPHIYSFDLTGSGTLQFPERRVFALAGLSEKTFDVIKLLEQDKNALVKKIESIKL